MKKYSVAEIDALRLAVKKRYLWGNANGPHVSVDGGGAYCSNPYNEDELTKIVEEQVRTYMLAELTGPDLMKADSRSP